MGMTVDDLMTWANPVVHEVAEDHKKQREEEASKTIFNRNKNKKSDKK